MCQSYLTSPSRSTREAAFDRYSQVLELAHKFVSTLWATHRLRVLQEQRIVDDKLHVYFSPLSGNRTETNAWSGVVFVLSSDLYSGMAFQEKVPGKEIVVHKHYFASNLSFSGEKQELDTPDTFIFAQVLSTVLVLDELRAVTPREAVTSA